jgi:hypothetical protein
VTTPNANGYIITGEAVLKYDKSYQVSVISGTHNIVLDNLKIHNHYDIQSTAFYVAQGATAHITADRREPADPRPVPACWCLKMPRCPSLAVLRIRCMPRGPISGAGIGGREATFTSYAFANSGTISIKGGVITAVRPPLSIADGIGWRRVYGYGGRDQHFRRNDQGDGRLGTLASAGRLRRTREYRSPS